MTVTARRDETLRLLWKAVEASPGDSGLRLIYADRLEELGEWDLAAACRATADRWPGKWRRGLVYWFDGGDSGCRIRYWVPEVVYRNLRRGRRSTDDFYRDYTTARAAMLDLWRAWVKVNKGGEG